jgi:hypothetical protein
MIFPDPKIKMSTFDKLKISVLLLTPLAIAGGQLASLLGGDTSQSIMTAVAIAFGGYFVKSIISYRNTVMKYIKNLTQGLYFKNLDNNSGVFDAVMGEAEEEEVKEAMLAYYFLYALGPMDEPTLDQVVEEWFRSKLSIHLDFEVDDAMHKLERLELASETGDGKWQVIPLDKALERLDHIWDNAYQYNKPGASHHREVPITGFQPPEKKVAAGDAVQSASRMQPLEEPIQPQQIAPGGGDLTMDQGAEQPSHGAQIPPQDLVPK